MDTFTIPAAAIALRINGKVHGAVSGFQWTSNTPYKAVNGIDDLAAQELIPTNAGVSGTIALYRITNSGGAEGNGLTTQFANLPISRYFVLQLIDTRTDTILFQARECVAVSQNWGIQVKGLMTGTLNFLGLSWANEVSQ